MFRAEHHDTSRHLNEYVSMDFEMGFIDSFYDIMNMETGALKYIMQLLKRDYAEEIALLNVDLPEITDIPIVKFMDAKEIITKKFKKKITDYRDFEPEASTSCSAASRSRRADRGSTIIISRSQK